MNQRFSESMNHNESAEQWNNESMNQRTNINGSTMQWINEVSQWITTNQWINESMSTPTNRWISGTVNHWIYDSTVQWINDQRISGSTIQWTNEPKVQRFKESMNQCIFPTSSSKSASRPSFFAFWSANCARAVGSFPQSRRKTAETQTRHHARKNTGFPAPECFHPWIHTLPDPFSYNYLMVGLTWWCTVELMVWMLTMTIVRNSEVC